MKVTRRKFLKKSAATGFAFTILPSYLALGKSDSAGNLPPSKRINLACIGTVGRSRSVIPLLCRGGHAKVVSFCDVDFTLALKDKRSLENLAAYPDAKRYADFRVMLDEMGDDIDAVSVMTPDHVHYVQTLEAMRRGKHVYTEKPLTHTFAEAEMLMQAEKKYNVVTQMGNQGHSSVGATQFQQLVAAGVIRDIVKIEAFKEPSLWFMRADKRINSYPQGQPVPAGLDWDLWCGPAKRMPYHRRYCPFDWRAFYLYGCGMLGDWGAHIIDFAHDYLKLGLPTRVESLGMDDHNQVIYPLATRLKYHFPARGADLPACDLYWRDGPDTAPKVDERYWDQGSDGELKAPGLSKAGSLLHRQDGKFLIHRTSHGNSSRLLPRLSMDDYRDVLKASPPKQDHTRGFIQACMGNGQTRSPFSVGGELTQVLMLGIIAQYLNEGFDFDPITKRVKNHPVADALLAGPAPRKGWEGYYAAI